MATTAGTAGINTNLAISGLASGFDWQSLVTQLIAVERQPETQLQTQQATFQNENSIYGNISTQLKTLNTDITALNDPTLFNSRLANVSDPTVATATADDTAALGTYTFNITQMGSAAVQQGTTDGGKALSATSDVSGLVLSSAGLTNPVTAGTFTVDGKTITIATSDTLQSVFDQINSATGGNVSGSYDPTTDAVSLTSGDGSAIVLGSATDTSNFLQVMKLYNNGTGAITSTSALGGVNLTNPVASSNLTTAITDGGSGAGALSINGVTINYDASTDSINDILQRINESSAGVEATYDPINDRFSLTNKNAGDVGITLQDVTGNFLAATGLSGGTLQRGTNLQYNINGGGTITSQSNAITSATSGLTGLTVTALKLGSTTVTVGSDTSKIQTAITTFVNDYNAVQNYLNSQTMTTKDSTGKTVAGTLTGDMDANNIQTKLRQLTTATPGGLSGTIMNLNSLGIESNGNDNTLAISDTTTLANALTSNLSQVKDLFTNATTGLGATLGAYLTATTSSTGVIATKQADFTKQSSDITTTIANMETRITNDQNRMTNEFVAMETARAQINLQAQYLTSAFGGSSSSSSSG
jgi:flagellar hook-associated protein 2